MTIEEVKMTWRYSHGRVYLNDELVLDTRATDLALICQLARLYDMGVKAGENNGKQKT